MVDLLIPWRVARSRQLHCVIPLGLLRSVVSEKLKNYRLRWSIDPEKSHSNLGNYGLRGLHFDVVDSCQVHPRDAVQLPTKIKTRLMSARVFASARFRYGFAQRMGAPPAFWDR